MLASLLSAYASEQADWLTGIQNVAGKDSLQNIHYVRTATRGSAPGTRCGFILRSIRPSSISGSFSAMSGRVSNFSAENVCNQRKTLIGVNIGLIPRTLGLSNDFTLQRLDLFACCVRLSRLLVGFRTHFKSLHFHFISFLFRFGNKPTRISSFAAVNRVNFSSACFSYLLSTANFYAFMTHSNVCSWLTYAFYLMYTSGALATDHSTPSSCVLCCSFRLSPAVPEARCPHFLLQMPFPGIPGSVSFSAAWWCPLYSACLAILSSFLKMFAYISI